MSNFTNQAQRGVFAIYHAIGLHFWGVGHQFWKPKIEAITHVATDETLSLSSDSLTVVHVSLA